MRSPLADQLAAGSRAVKPCPICNAPQVDADRCALCDLDAGHEALARLLLQTGGEDALRDAVRGMDLSPGRRHRAERALDGLFSWIEETYRDDR